MSGIPAKRGIFDVTEILPGVRTGSKRGALPFGILSVGGHDNMKNHKTD